MRYPPILSLLVAFTLAGCGLRDEQGNLNPTQLRVNAEAGVQAVSSFGQKVERAAHTAGDVLTTATDAATQAVATTKQAATRVADELAEPKAPPAGVTQPYH